jgi:hypothetical protein
MSGGEDYDFESDTGFLAPIPASFDFATSYASSPILFYNPLSPGGPQLLAGWQRLIGAFAGAVGSSQGQTGDWTNAGFALEWLAVRAYDDWRWSKGNPRLPVRLHVPFKAGNSRAVLEIFVAANTLGSVWADYLSQGF